MTSFAQRLAETDADWSARVVNGAQHRIVHRVAAILAHSGDSWFWLLGLIVVAAASQDLRRWAVQVAAVVFAAAALVLIIKFTVRRSRPQGSWGGIYRRSDPHSFPSGHAVRAVLIAVLCVGWGPERLAPILVLWAPLVVWARVALGLHYLSDVIAGAGLGLGLGLVSLALLPTPL